MKRDDAVNREDRRDLDAQRADAEPRDRAVDTPDRDEEPRRWSARRPRPADRPNTSPEASASPHPEREVIEPRREDLAAAREEAARGRGESVRVEPTGAARPEPVDASTAVEPRRHEVRRTDRDRILFRAGQVVDYLFFLLYGLLGIRFVLTLLAAAPTAGFVQFIHSVTDPFYQPFTGIVARPEVDGGMIVDFPLIIAFLAYVLLHAAVKGLLRLLGRNEATVTRT